ncbi:hypothetical protein [Bacillus infantis]|jgi:uncharacterized membrane protein YkoI|uniref:hypothetical protein n=1 Tax=Bacillus infantis TaxID=324767 RepID=UPI0021552D48|nr:hypothetical protein [Bacillus infantis]MCR6609547.1 hypothetical protein [Bacillus infantis]
MKKVGSILTFVILLVATGCEPKITEEQAKSIVIKHYTNENGKAEIISVTHKQNEYIVEWEKKDNCERGTDRINDQNGEMGIGEVSIC